jgi:hypothetical protein
VRSTLRRILLVVTLAWSAGLVWAAFNPAPHSGGDNAAYLALADAVVEGDGYVDAYDPQRAPHSKYPPLFPLVLAGAALLGASTWGAFKLIVAVATVLATGLVFLWAERRLEPWRAFAVTVLLASSSGVVYYSHWILSDPLFVLLTVLALWALERGGSPSWDARWLAVGVGAALGAYFTRSAGLPLLMAVLAWLALRRRYRALGVVAAVFAVPAGLWWIRGLGVGVGDYGAEFWLVDPYQPGLGTVSPTGLLGRAASNAMAYATRHVPTALVGAHGPWIAVFGLALLGAAARGWLTRVRAATGVAEIFLPLYLGLVLVWPEVWGGDRFVLPVLPLLLVYAATALEGWTRRLGGGAHVVGGLVVAAVLVPALGSFAGAARDARTCASVLETGGPFGCYGPRVVEFVDAAAWMGEALPEGSAVMTRKPRIFYVVSGGIPSRAFPFDPSPEVQLAVADEVGARYVFLDRWDGQAGRFAAVAVQARPGAFCFVRGFGPGASGSSQLLGILPPSSRSEGIRTDAGVSLGPCPADYVVPGDATAREDRQSSSSTTTIPLFSSSVP